MPIAIPASAPDGATATWLAFAPAAFPAAIAAALHAGLPAPYTIARGEWEVVTLDALVRGRGHAADLATSLTAIKARTRDDVAAMGEAQRAAVKDGQQDLQRLSEWAELTQEEQSQVLAQLDPLVTDVPQDLHGLRQLLSHEQVISSRVAEQKSGVAAAITVIHLGRDCRSRTPGQRRTAKFSASAIV